MKSDKAWLIDASIYIFRAWHSLPDRWHTADGWPLNAVYGYTKFLLDFITRAEPVPHCAVAFDESLGTCYRNAIYPAYKQSRQLPDEALAFQLQACREVTERLGIPCFGGPHYEADDYLASLSRLFHERQIPVVVVTRDKDLGQLLQRDADRWWDFAADLSLDAYSFREKFGVRPEQFADYLALVGDPVDDVPGVPGVGARTAARLLQRYGDLAGVHRNLDRIAALDIRGAAGLQQRLQESWEQVELARRLTGLEGGIPGLELPTEFHLGANNAAAVLDYLQQLDIRGPLVRRWRELEQQLASQ